MPTKKMRVELFDSDGNKYTISFEGQISREKAVKLLDLIELLGGMPTNDNDVSANVNITNNSVTKIGRVYAIIQKDFPLGWFSSKEVQLVYEQELGKPINLSTVATYLARLTHRGILVKTGAANSLKYRIAKDLPSVQLKSPLPS